MIYDFSRLRKEIVLRGLTLQQVEELSGVPYATVSRVIKTGQAWPSTAVRLVKAFELTMEDIYIEERE
jgi:transcriptional regulator with XRE-family HTH domain